MKYKLLALDLDGTLTNSEKKVTLKTKEAIRKVINIGVKVVLASGRPVLGIKHIAEELDLQSGAGYILAYNGGKIISCKDNSVIFEKLISLDIVHDICSFARANSITALSYDKVGIITEKSDDTYVKKEAFNNSIGIREVNQLECAIDKPVEKIMLVGEPDGINRVLPIMQHRFAGILNIFCSEPYFLEVMPLDIEKSTSLKVLLDYLSIEKEEVVACGDGLNDIPMINYVGMGVAMENACEEVKKCAKYVTSSNDQDGVAKAIDELILI